jgi:hypothetical protein
MKFLSGVLLLLAVSAQAAAPVVTNIANFPSVSVAYTNYVAEAKFTNGVSIGGVRKTAWPDGTIWTNAAGTVRLITENANPTLKLEADDLASGGTLELWIGGSKRWTLNNGALFPEANYDVGTSVKPVQVLYVGGAGIHLDDRLIIEGAGTPEGVHNGPVGSIFLRSDGASGTTIYTKTTGAGNTGWAALVDSSQLAAYATLASPALTGTVTVNGSSLQTQLTNKVAKAGDSMSGPLFVTGLTNSALTGSKALATAADKSLVSATTSAAELNFVAGVTSAIQTQMDLKAPLASPALTGTVTVNGASLDTQLTNKVSKTGDAMTGTLTNSPAANTSSLIITNGSMTSSNLFPLIDVATTWNNANGTNTVMRVNLTDTASGAASLFQDWQVGGNSRYKIGKLGDITLAGPINITNSFSLVNDATVANTMAVRNSTAQMGVNIYKTYTSDSVYERMRMGWDGSTLFEIRQQNVGGSARDLQIQDAWRFTSAGVLQAKTDNTYDIGTVSNFRPRVIYSVSSVAVGTSTANTFVIVGTTNQVTFGATNAAPVGSITTPTKWISVLVSGEATVYRVPLYQ